MKKRRTLLDEYRFAGCRPLARVRGIFGDPMARVVVLKRLQKKASAESVAPRAGTTTTSGFAVSATCPAQMRESIWKSRFAA